MTQSRVVFKTQRFWQLHFSQKSGEMLTLATLQEDAGE